MLTLDTRDSADCVYLSAAPTLTITVSPSQRSDHNSYTPIDTYHQASQVHRETEIEIYPHSYPPSLSFASDNKNHLQRIIYNIIHDGSESSIFSGKTAKSSFLEKRHAEVAGIR